LLVEDDEAVALAIRDMLAADGFDVRVVHFGRQVIGNIVRERPDVIVFDLMLPDVGGGVVATAVRKAWPDLPIIISTGHERPPDLEPFLREPGVAFLQKPYDIDDLARAIRHAVTR
jgi:two-component system OmpR family response regulator